FAIFRCEITTGCIDCAEQEAGDQSTGYGARAANGDNHQKGHHVAECVIGLDGQKFRTNDPTEGCKPDSKRKADCINDFSSHTESRRHIGIVDCGAQFHAESSAFHDVPEAKGDCQTTADCKDTVFRNSAKSEIDRSA